MTMGRAPGQGELFHATTRYCEEALGPTSIYRYLHAHCHRLFPDEMFADLFQDIGRESVPPRILAVVMVLQRLEGLSDREAVERFAYDVRWKYAAGGLEPFDFFISSLKFVPLVAKHTDANKNLMFSGPVHAAAVTQAGFIVVGLPGGAIFVPKNQG